MEVELATPSLRKLIAAPDGVDDRVDGIMSTPNSLLSYQLISHWPYAKEMELLYLAKAILPPAIPFANIDEQVTLPGPTTVELVINGWKDAESIDSILLDNESGSVALNVR